MKYFKWIWPYVRQQRWLLMTLVLVTTVQMLTQFGGTYFQKRLLDEVIVNGHMERLGSIVFTIALCYASTAALTFISPFVSLQNYTRIRFDLSQWLLQYVSRLPIFRIQRERVNDLVGLFQWHLHIVPFAFSDRLWVFTQQLVMGVALIGFLLWVSPYMMLVCLVTAVLYVWMGFKFGKKIMSASKNVWDARFQLGVCLEEGVSATREMVSYHLDDWDRIRYNAIFDKYIDKVDQEMKVKNDRFLYGNSMEWAVRVFILIFGCYLVFEGRATIGEFVVSYIFGSQLLGVISTLFGSATDIIGNLANVERVQEFTAEELPAAGVRKLDTGIKSISFRRVRFAYPETDRTVLTDLDLELPIGRMIAVVGASGSGKSTLASVLFGIHEPTEGEVVVNGVPLRERDFDEWREYAAIVLQESYLFRDTIRSNIVMGLGLVSDEEIARVCRIAQLQSFIESLPEGLDTIIGERGITLSGGQRQRLAIARAMLRPSELLILDEATSALDLETERRFQALLQQERRGKTTVIIAHRLSTVRAVDWIVVMENGRVVEQGTHDSLMSVSSQYRRLVESEKELQE